MSVVERQSLQDVMKNLNKEINAIQGATMKGLIEGARIVREDMDKTSPKVPVGKTGNLRSSWTVVPIYIGRNPVIMLGFTANYALKVHESYGVTFKRPGAGAGFFVAAIKRNKGHILEEIKKSAKV